MIMMFFIAVVPSSVRSHVAEIDCGVPPPIPHSVRLWDHSSTLGSRVIYECNAGYRNVGEGNVSVCTARRQWDGASPLCQGENEITSLGSKQQRRHPVWVTSVQPLWPTMTRCLSLVEIKCQQPVVKPHAKTLWDGSPHIGSVVYYQCEEGFYTRSLRNYSVCGENGLWEDIDLLCEGATFDHRCLCFIYAL